MAPSSGEKKLGQPVPLSNFRSATNNRLLQPAHENVPARCSCSSAQEPGRSVACSRSTAYCSGVSDRRHSSSDFVTGNGACFMTSGLYQLGECYLQRAFDRELPAATTRGPRRARLRGGVGAERPEVTWEGIHH